jgi:hypothetical protein
MNQQRAFNNYSLYGISLRSQWRLPCPAVTDNGGPGVTLLKGLASLFSPEVLKLKRQADRPGFSHFESLQGGATYIRWFQLFEFLISPDGHFVIGHGLSHSGSEAFLSYLLGQALSFSIIKQGGEPLHSTVVEIDGQGVGFIGDCGYGKSTLAAAFLQMGYPLLTDDLLALSEDSDSLLAYPGLPRIKLFSDIAKKVLGERVMGFPITPSSAKLIVPLAPSQSIRTPIPLKAIYVLSPPAPGSLGRKATVRKLPGRKALMSIIRNTYNAKIAEPERLKRQFIWASKIVSRIPIKALSYPRTLESLSSVREAVLGDLETR